MPIRVPVFGADRLAGGGRGSGNRCGCRTPWPPTREACPAARRAVTDRGFGRGVASPGSATAESFSRQIPTRTIRDDSLIQRGRLNPEHRHFGARHSRTQPPRYARAHGAASTRPDKPLDTKRLRSRSTFCTTAGSGGMRSVRALRACQGAMTRPRRGSMAACPIRCRSPRMGAPWPVTGPTLASPARSRRSD
jgi:hypothetical protein